jgi:hypothetical protein
LERFTKYDEKNEKEEGQKNRFFERFQTSEQKAGGGRVPKKEIGFRFISKNGWSIVFALGG